MSLASDERAALCLELDRVGPDRPTLCEGWTTRDLLAHLLVRERAPWAAAGIAVKPLAGITERAMASWAGTPWTEMVDLLRVGAPLWSPYRIGTVDALVNGAEFFVHHEDVRRGEPGWEPRPPDPVRDEQLWTLLGRMGRVLYRSSPVGVTVRRSPSDQKVLTSGSRTVILLGEPGELVLHAFGRDAVRVEVEGEPADVTAFAATSRGI
ncbi:MAG: TIGR03085 family metal-binding protein [Pseudonocardiales bacterium]|jgi:uncharacterized protein (TIGR03085 family)|nr:TIGR03085 family metal-binding protein [Pseudonocardiales bacterium]